MYIYCIYCMYLLYVYILLYLSTETEYNLCHIVVIGNVLKVSTAETRSNCLPYLSYAVPVYWSSQQLWMGRTSRQNAQ